MSEAAEHHARAQRVAEMVAKRAEDTLSVLGREMIIMKWPAEFRVIMWDAVAAMARQRAEDARE